MTTLLVIESNKKDQYMKAFREAGVYDISCFSTRGRLYDLPEDRLGINLEDYSKFERVPLSESKIKNLLKEISKSKNIIISTDDDFEGELIAYDIKRISHDLSPDHQIKRIRLHSVTKNGVLEALSGNGEIDLDMVKGCLSRRIYDRLVGYEVSSHDNSRLNALVGRTITPVISHLKKTNGQITKSWISKSYLIDGKNIDVKFPITADTFDEIGVSGVESLAKAISDIPPPKISIIDEKDGEKHELWDGPTALLSLSKALGDGVSVIDVDECLQDLYEEGRISYARTDSIYLSSESIQNLERISDEIGARGFDGDYLRKEGEVLMSGRRSQGGHEALIPLNVDSSAFFESDDISIKDQCFSHILQNTLRASQSERVTLTRSAKLTSSIENMFWQDLQNKYGAELIIESNVTIMHGREVSYNEEVMPLYSYSASKDVGNDTHYRVIPNDVIVLDLMYELGLGRPSTMAIHATKISNQFMNKSGQLNNRAYRSIERSEEFAPGLIDHKTSKEIEDSLHYGGNDVSKRLSEGFRLSGISAFEVHVDKRGKKDTNESLETFEFIEENSY